VRIGLFVLPVIADLARFFANAGPAPCHGYPMTGDAVQLPDEVPATPPAEPAFDNGAHSGVKHWLDKPFIPL